MTATLDTITRATRAILRVADANENITVAGLRDELERGAIDGWTAIVTRYAMTFSEWSGAMELAIETIEAGAYGRNRPAKAA